MLNIRFERTSAPITDTELQSVIEGIRPAITDPAHPDKDYALLLARMVIRMNDALTDVGRARFLIQNWYATLDGIALPHWIGQQALKLGGVKAAIDVAISLAAVEKEQA